MLVYRSTVAAVTFGGALLVGCTDPDQPTDLRKNGPPSVTTVMVMSDLTADRLLETATFCRTGDEKRPGLVGLPDIRVIQVCPEDLAQPAPDEGNAEGAPPVWFARIVFDELLDPAIEDLVPVIDEDTGNQIGTLGTLKNTQPVTLKCGPDSASLVDVPYDGYYVPNGNRLSWPLGPALYIQPLDAASVPTDATCTVSVKDNVHNKAGQQVTSKRDFQFKLAPMALLSSDPDPADSENGDLLVDLDATVDLSFTAAPKLSTVIKTADGKKAITLTTLDPNLVKISSGPNLNITPSNPDGDADPGVCNGGGTPIADPTTIRTFVSGENPSATSEGALIMHLGIAGGATPITTSWAPNTTYLVTFDATAAVEAAQGGPPGALADYKLCFHTPAPST